MRDPKIPLFITIGICSADAAISNGLCCIGLLNEWGWRGTNEKNGKTALPDWDCIALPERQILIVVHSSLRSDAKALLGVQRLAGLLKQRRGQVRFIELSRSKDSIADEAVTNEALTDENLDNQEEISQ